MNLATALLLVNLLMAVARAGTPDFERLLAAVKTQSEGSASPISLTAVGRVEGKELLLKFHLTNVSNDPLTFRDRDLPWGDPGSVTWVAFVYSGRALPRASILRRPDEGTRRWHHRR
jgi:hypothetical protein